MNNVGEIIENIVWIDFHYELVTQKEINEKRVRSMFNHIENEIDFELSAADVVYEHLQLEFRKKK